MINALTGKPYSEKIADALADAINPETGQHYADPRWMTAKQADELGGYAKCPIAGDMKSRFERFKGIQRLSGVRRAELQRAVAVSVRIPYQKNGETKTMRRFFKLYNLEQTFGARETTLGGGTVPIPEAY